VELQEIVASDEGTILEGTLASAGGATIRTDKGSYSVGEPIQYCFTVPGPGQVRIIDLLPDGRSQTILTRQDDGRGGCETVLVTPPSGRECLRLEWSNTRGETATATACFEVLA
jgi:hypothetical protein